ncbi:hypothetical protein AB6813_11820 [bacterium RCC_150]
MSGYGPESGGIRFAAAAGSVSGYGGRGVDGSAYSSSEGFLFTDGLGKSWWIVFQPWEVTGSSGAGDRGDILGCSAGYGEVVHVRVLAKDVLRDDADGVFTVLRPATYEEAVRAAASISRSGR